MLFLFFKYIYILLVQSHHPSISYAPFQSKFFFGGRAKDIWGCITLVPQHWFVFLGMKCCLIRKDHCTTYPSQEFCDPQNIPKPTRRCDRRLKEHCLASIENRLNSCSGTGWHRRVGARFGVARSAFFGVQKTVKSDKTAFFPGRREPNAAQCGFCISTDMLSMTYQNQHKEWTRFCFTHNNFYGVDCLRRLLWSYRR